MKTYIVRLGLVLSVVASPLFSQNTVRGPFSVKGNVYYAAHGDRSRVSLLFKGKVQHAETREGNTLTIICSGIAAAPSHNASNLSFKDGLVRHVTVDRIDNGSTKVVLTLRTGTEAYDVVGDDAKGIVRVDVFRNPFAVKPARLAKAVIPATISPRKSQPANTMQPETQTPPVPIVDLPSMVRGQMADALTEKQVQPAADVSPTQQSSITQVQATKSAVAWLSLACASLLATLITMIALVRKAMVRKNRASMSAQSQKNIQVQPLRSRVDEMTDDRELKNRRREEFERPVSRGIDAWDPTEESGSSTLSLAEQYRRSQGDIELAMKLRDKDTMQAQDPKVGVIKSVKLPKKGTVRMARKNGVGSGELDLAAKLRRLQHAFSDKEEVR